MRKLLALLLVLILSLGTFAACASSQAGTFESRKKEIERAWLKRNEDTDGKVRELVWSTDLENAKYQNVRYYGTYNDYDILFHRRTSILAVTGQIEIAGKLFEHGCPFDLYAYRDGEFYELKDIHNEGLITDEQISEILQTHNEFENAPPS